MSGPAGCCYGFRSKQVSEARLSQQGNLKLLWFQMEEDHRELVRIAMAALSSVLEKGKGAHARNVVLPGNLVESLAVSRPHNQTELKQIGHGLGTNKRNAYGPQIFLAIGQVICKRQVAYGKLSSPQLPFASARSGAQPLGFITWAAPGGLRELWSHELAMCCVIIFEMLLNPLLLRSACEVQLAMPMSCFAICQPCQLDLQRGQEILSPCHPQQEMACYGSKWLVIY